MKLFFLTASSVILISFGGCATQYQKASLSGGFVEKQKSRNEFSVLFGGNGYTSGQRAIDLCMLRCAELTLGHGFNYFALTTANVEFDKSTAVTTGNFIPTGYGGGVMLSTTQVIPKPLAGNTILCFRGRPPSIVDLFDARKLFAELSQKYATTGEVETFQKFVLSKATIGVGYEIVKPRPNTTISRWDNNPDALDKSPKYVVRRFSEGSQAQNCGMRVGDQILAIDGVPISASKQIIEQNMRTEIGQKVQVNVRRDDLEIVIPVTTTLNSELRFERLSDIRAKEPVSEKNVTVFEGPLGQVTAIPISQFEDWENPCESLEEFKSYALAVAANAGANCVQLLNSPQAVKNVNPNANNRVGFLCGLLLKPDARLGVEFELGAGYENRRVIRRIQNEDAANAGLLIGDNILAMNGIDVLRNADLAASDQVKWEVGQVVEVTVARDGREVKTPVKTVANK